MITHQRIPFDFKKLAENGLRRGVTTGTCATAAVKAALYKLLTNEDKKEIIVNLVDKIHYVTIPVFEIKLEQPNCIKATVVKDAGDDPDVTHQAKIVAMVKANQLNQIRFKAGSGVGTITQPGFEFPIGDPAINPVPRQMMVEAVHEVIKDIEYTGGLGFDLEIGCVNGAQIAKKTYNPRLGIVDGISILGTTGIVEPKSLSSYLASIDLYIRIAIAAYPNEIVFSPGNIGQRFAEKILHLPTKSIVQMSNFVGYSLDSLNHILEEQETNLDCLWIAGHPGKLAKLLDQVWDTHSKASSTAAKAICQVAQDFRFDENIINQCKQTLTAENIIKLLKTEKKAPAFWTEVEHKIADIVKTKAPRVDKIKVRLFSMNGTLLRKGPKIS